MLNSGIYGRQSHIRAAVVVVALALTSCGGDSGDRAKGGTLARDLTAVMCPMVPTKNAGGVERYEPAANAFDTAALVGKPLSDARDEARRHGCEIQVSKEDGSGLPVPIDFSPQRIYVFVERAVVTQIEGVGGGL